MILLVHMILCRSIPIPHHTFIFPNPLPCCSLYLLQFVTRAIRCICRPALLHSASKAHKGPSQRTALLTLNTPQPKLARFPDLGPVSSLPEPRTTSAHDLALADKLRIELTPIEREIDIEVNTVEGPLRRVHPLKVLLQVLP